MPVKSSLTNILRDEGYFFGREKDSEQLGVVLAANKLVVIEGLSGIGKTALALHYAYKSLNDYDVCVWHEIQTDESIEAVLTSIAAQLNEQEFPALLEAVTDPRKDWRTRINVLIDVLRKTRVLLIFDSFNNCLDDTNHVSSGFIPLVDQLLGQNYNSRVILTTKIKIQISPTHLSHYHVYELMKLDDQDAITLFMGLCKDVGYDISDYDASRVSRMAGGHPFALKIVVGLLQGGFLLPSLLEQMRGMVISDYGQFLLDILYTRLTRGAKRLLEACSAYRRSVSLAAIGQLPADAKLMDQLLPLFLLEREPRSQRYFMHTIVREYAYSKLARDEVRRKQVHKAVGDYYAAAIGDIQRKQHDFISVQRILEAQYHYREAGDQTGIINTAAYVADELKPLVRQLYRDGNNELASKLYSAILSIDDQDAEMHYYYARLLEKQGGVPDEIERHYREALTLAPRVLERQVRYLRYLVSIKKYDEAHRAFKKAIESCGAYPDIYVAYSKAMKAAGKYDQAISALKESFSHVGKNNLSPLYQEYSQVLRSRGKLEDAAAALKEGVNRVPPEHSVPLYLEYSQVLRSQGKLEDAAAALKEGINRVPPEQNISALYVVLANVLRDLGNLDDANSVLREGIQRIQVPQVGYLITALANNLCIVDDYEAANAELRLGIERWPSLPNLHICLASNLLSQNKPEEAERVLLTAKEKVPQQNTSSIYIGLARFWDKKGDLVKAADNYKIACEFGHPVSSSQYANFLWHQGKIDEANDKFEQALSLRSIHGSNFWPLIYRAYASFLIHTGKEDKARQILAEKFHAATPAEIDNMIAELAAMKIGQVDAGEDELLSMSIEETSLDLRDGSQISLLDDASNKVEVLNSSFPIPSTISYRPQINILHISDIHRGVNAPTSNQVLLGKLKDDILRTYSEDNAKLGEAEPHLGIPDIIIVSGDLTQHADSNEFDIANEFLEGLLELVGGDRQKVVLVPGNHDVNWELSKKSYIATTQQEFREQEIYNEPYRQTVKKDADANKYWRKISEASYTERLKAYKKLFDSFYHGTGLEHTYATDREQMYTVYDYSKIYGLVIVGFNSCDEIDHLDRRAFINTEAIYRAEENPNFHAGESGLIRIGVFHHNIRSINHDEDFLEPKYLQILKRHEFDLCLHGHVHTTNLDIFDPDQVKILPVLGAGSLAVPYKDRPPAAPKGYNLITINRETGMICAHTRRHDEDHVVWAADYRWSGKPYVVIRSPQT